MDSTMRESVRHRPSRQVTGPPKLAHPPLSVSLTAVKKEALRRPGVRYIEVTPEHDSAHIALEISRIAKSERLRPTSGPCPAAPSRGPWGQTQRTSHDALNG